jgi:hypothetical protein
LKRREKNMERKAQGAIEYLLIIGAAILVVAIVIIAVTSVLSQGKGTGDQAMQDEKKQQDTLRCTADCTALGACFTVVGTAADPDTLIATSCAQFSTICVQKAANDAACKSA